MSSNLEEMIDKTIRNAQANLITAQNAKIVELEQKLRALALRIRELEAEQDPRNAVKVSA